MTRQTLTAILEREGDGYVALCPEVDVASQGDTVEEATNNLREAVELFFESANAEETKRRVKGEVFVTRLEVAIRIGTLQSIIRQSGVPRAEFLDQE